MSGGYFNYRQHQAALILEQLRDKIQENDEPEEIKHKIIYAFHHLQKSLQMIDELDLYLSYDNGPDSFLRNWNEKVLEVEGLATHLEESESD